MIIESIMRWLGVESDDPDPDDRNDDAWRKLRARIDEANARILRLEEENDAWMRRAQALRRLADELGMIVPAPQADQSIYLVVIRDKDLSGEPDVGFAIVQGDEHAAHAKVLELESEMVSLGRGRCVGRCSKIDRGKHYRAKAFIRTP